MHDQDHTGLRMTFIELMQRLEQELGYHQWPVNPAARELREVFDNSPVNGQLAVRIMRSLYKNNLCQKPADAVTLDQCDKTLIPIRLELVHSQTTDIDAYQFMEQMCHAIHKAWMKKHNDDNNKTETGTTTADIVLLKTSKQFI
ncbi:MAG: hypothetical protein IME93_01545 [Proteobacteria bacterium]|nr:hypothetical protein [Pseudomonadota bacterium]